MDLYNFILESFKEREFLNYETIIPEYICSVGAHIFNRVNKEKDIYVDNGLTPDCRLNIFMITISGFGKTYLLNQFMDKKVGFLSDTKVEVSRVGEVTASGLTGTIRSTSEGKSILQKGLLQKKSNGIIGSEEFSTIMATSRQAHSTNLINILLIAFDTGEVTKDVAPGGFDFFTKTTMWAATQPGRYETTSGLPRRFLFVIYIPSYKDMKLLNEKRSSGKHIVVDKKKLLLLRSEIDKRVIEVEENLKKIVFPREFYKWLDNFTTLHYEIILYERLLLGYNIMKIDKVGEVLELKVDDCIKEVIERQIKNRLLIHRGINKVKIWDILKHIKTIKMDNFQKIMFAFSLEEDEINRGLEKLKSNKYIQIVDDNIVNFKYKGE